MRVLFFGALQEKAGARERMVEPPAGVDSGERLIEWLGAENESLREALSHPSVRLAVEGAIAERGAPLGDAKEVAFLPPFSGG